MMKETTVQNDESVEPKDRSYVVTTPIKNWEFRGVPSELAMVLNAPPPTADQVAQMKDAMETLWADGRSGLFMTPSGIWRFVWRIEMELRNKKAQKTRARNAAARGKS